MTDQTSPVTESALSVLIKQYALDLRRNASGGDDYPYDFAKGVADYLGVLIKRAKGDCTCARAGFPDSCDYCDGTGMVGGFVSAESGYQTDPCPVCSGHAQTPDHIRKLEQEVARLRSFAESFHVTVVDNFYKDVTLVLEQPHTLAIRLRNDSTKSWIFADLEARRKAALSDTSTSHEAGK